jgi:hypothetical protein
MSDSDRSIPPLDQHLKTIKEQWNEDRVHRTRMDKAIDFLIGEWIDEAEWEQHDKHPPCLIHKVICKRYASNAIALLELTATRPHLPNRIRLLELVEAAMPKVSQNETAKGGE